MDARDKMRNLSSGRTSNRTAPAQQKALLPQQVQRSDSDSATIPAQEAQGFLEATINMAENLTGIDLDGDGDIGLAGSKNKPQKLKSIYDVLIAATAKERRKFFNAGRRLMELEELVEKSWWLSPNMLRLKVEMRDGATSCSANMARVLQGRCVQLMLIVLLLLDVGLVCGEIFMEAYYPSCNAVRRSAVSCCPVSASGPIASPAHAAHADASPLEILLERGKQLLGAKGGADHHHELDGCPAPLTSNGDFEIGCVVNGFMHALHVSFSVLSLLILVVFALEIFALVCTFRELFLRAPGMVIDLFVVSLALWLQWEVLKVDLGLQDHEETWSGKQFTTLVLLFRFVRFIRVYHGAWPARNGDGPRHRAPAPAPLRLLSPAELHIAPPCETPIPRLIRAMHKLARGCCAGITSSMHQQQQQQQDHMKHTVDALDSAVGALVTHVPLGKHAEVERVYNHFRELRQQMEMH